MLKTVLPCLLVSGLLVGCAPSKGTSDVVAAAAVSTAPAPIASAAEYGTIDGLYKGRATPINQSGRCGPFRDPTLRIRNNRIVRHFGHNTLVAAIQPDGTFSAQAGRTRMSGKVADNHLDAEIGNEYCRYRYALDRT